MLGDVDELVLAHGPRGSDGASPVAWAQRGRIAQAWSLLADAGLPVDALVPAPLALPLHAEGGITLMLHDGFLLCRTGRDTGQALALDPLGPQDATDPSVQAFLRVLWMRHPEAEAAWVDAVPTGWNAVFEGRGLPPTTVLPDAARWSAPLPTWSLAVPALRPARLQRSPWRRPLAWVAAAVAVWTVGLNVYALRLEQEASALRQRMASEVRAAFPALPVVLDPLRQATQQRDALLAGTGSVTDTDFLPLALAASQLLPMSANNVASLAYADDTLSLRLIDNAAAGVVRWTRPSRPAHAGLAFRSISETVHGSCAVRTMAARQPTRAACACSPAPPRRSACLNARGAPHERHHDSPRLA